MPKLKLTEGDARLLVAVFEHLKPYDEQAKAKGTSVADEMKNADMEDLNAYTSLLKTVLKTRLNDRERKVITQRLELSADGKPHTLEEIAREFGVTRERMRQVESKALNKIRRYMTEFNGEETHNATFGLLRKEIESKKNMIDACKACDFVLSEVYMRDSINCYNAYSKLKIQQAIRKWRETHEQSKKE